METTMQTKYGAFPIRITHLRSIGLAEYTPVEALSYVHNLPDGTPPQVKEVTGISGDFRRITVRLTNGFEYHARYEYIPQEGA